MKSLGENIYIISICMAGTIVRFIYGYLFDPWLAAPDHQAFEAILHSGFFSYELLIHYPHEGGSLISGIAGWILNRLTDLNSLVITALALDTISRYMQIFVVFKLFSKQIAISFGLWTVFTSASILPWGTVNYGLHSISSFFPFILLYLLFLKNQTKKLQIYGGLFLGFAVWFSLSNLILVPVYFGLTYFSTAYSKKWRLAAISFLSLMLVYIIIRLNFSAGFELESPSIFTIRGLSFDYFEIPIILNFLTVWFTTLPFAAAGVPNDMSFPSILVLVTWMILFLIAALKLLSVLKKKSSEQHKIVTILLISTLFIIVYSISPLYEYHVQVGKFIIYRHLAYIIPLISLLMFIGLSHFKYSKALTYILILVSIYSGGKLFFVSKQAKEYKMAIGWVLAKKLGHDPLKLTSIIQNTELDQNKTMQGVAWGICDALFNNTDNNKEFTSKIESLKSTLSKFPEVHKKNLEEGVKYAMIKSINSDLNERNYNYYLKSYFDD